ncbi:hypothetical protein TRVA0_024S01552 [Trichomonascus vanleenenianus]|uniref:uncharacterized protein n=1 Tax=Trichomonascus vanleenenianus TaxID=2268995 RepID=UPI003ECAA11C
MTKPTNRNIKKRNRAYIEPEGSPFDTRRVPQELWAAIFKYVDREPISLWQYRLVCRNLNSAINPLIWNCVLLHIDYFNPKNISNGSATLYDQSPLKLHEIRTVEEIVEQVITKENACRTVQALLDQVYTEYLTHGVKYEHLIAENLRNPSRELMAQIDNAWRPNRKSDKKTAAKIGRLIKNFECDYMFCSTMLRGWRLKHAFHFVNRHIDDIRTVSISFSNHSTKMNSPYSCDLLDMAVELAAAPGLNRVDFSVSEADDGSLADTILKKFRGRHNVEFELNVSSDKASLLEKLKPFDQPRRATVDFRDYTCGETQINPAAFKSLRKLAVGGISSNWHKALWACPNLTDLDFEPASIAYDEFDGVLQLPETIEKLKLSSRSGGFRRPIGAITARGVKVLDLRTCMYLQPTLNLPSLETLILGQDSVGPSPMVSQLMERRQKIGQIKALCFESQKTDQLVQLLNHFRPSESLYFMHEGTFMEDYLEENIMAFRPGGPGFDGLEHFNGDDDYFHSDDDDFDDYAECVEKDKFNIMQMASLWKCRWIPPQVAILFRYEYSKAWHSVINHFASLPRVSRLYVDFDSGLNRLPRHFYGPYRLTDDWCKNYHPILHAMSMAFIYVDKKIAKDRSVKRPRIVAKYFS